VELLYLALPSVELSRLRVAERVRHGGHDIPVKDIERRFPRSLRNLLDHYGLSVDACRCYINTGAEPVLVFEQQGEHRGILHQSYYERLLDEARP
jgi:predicted ABC-type ATPase